MPGYNVLVNFPHGEAKVFLDVDMPRAGVVYTGFDGEKWRVTEAKVRDDVVEGQETQFEATVEQIEPDQPPTEWV
jgi:hypothetical protein